MSKRAEKAKAAIARAKAQVKPEPTKRQAKADFKYAEVKSASQMKIEAAIKRQGGGK